ncbi:MAG: hypothetical protein NDI73_02875 [Desulfuromonadales bacterium]|nr:hypothetical protein [Desulfuromonadales bacterium]
MPKSVLLIDKHAAARGMLRFALELQGYRVAEADGASGVPGALAAGNPDLLVIGVDPSDTGSGDLIKEVRWRPGLGSLPILLVGEDRYADQWDLRMIGNCAWLNKPFCMGELPGLIESLLGAVSLPGDRLDQHLIHGNGDA